MTEITYHCPYCGWQYGKNIEEPTDVECPDCGYKFVAIKWNSKPVDNSLKMGK